MDILELLRHSEWPFNDRKHRGATRSDGIALPFGHGYAFLGDVEDKEAMDGEHGGVRDEFCRVCG